MLFRIYVTQDSRFWKRPYSYSFSEVEMRLIGVVQSWEHFDSADLVNNGISTYDYGGLCNRQCGRL